MAASMKSAKLDEMSAGLTLEEAQERLDEAIANEEIRTNKGRVATGELGYYNLRLLATGSHQYSEVDVPDDIRRAAWVVYKATSPPESAQRRNKEFSDAEGNRVTVRRSGKGLVVPYGADREAMKVEAARLIDEWFEGEGARIAEENASRAKKAVQQVKTLGVSDEQLAQMLSDAGIDIAALAKLAK